MAKTPEEKAAEKAAKEAAKASAAVVKKLEKLGVTDLTGKETLAELEARLQVAEDAAKADKEAKEAAAKAEKDAADAAKKLKGAEPEEAEFRETGRFEVVNKKGKFLVYNPSGALVGKYENDREASEFVLRSNKLLGL